MIIFNDSVRHLVKFLLVGVISTFVNYSVFLLLLREAKGQYQFDSICGFLAGVCIGFPLNKVWTYKYSNDIKSSGTFYKYWCVYIFSLFVNFFVLGFLVKNFNLDPRVANGIAIIVTTMINFIGTKFWAFRVASKT